GHAGTNLVRRGAERGRLLVRDLRRHDAGADRADAAAVQLEDELSDQPAHEADRLAVQRREASLDDGRRGPAAAAAVDDAAAAARSDVEGGAPELAEQQSADRCDLRVRRLS